MTFDQCRVYLVAPLPIMVPVPALDPASVPQVEEVVEKLAGWAVDKVLALVKGLGELF